MSNKKFDSKKLLHGFGIKDTSDPVGIFEFVGGRKKQVWSCPFYVAWASMIKRCYNENYKNKFPTYSNCSVSPEWALFSSFKKWMSDQDWIGKHLDKDILFPGNKTYSPDRCAFVSAEINLFVIDSGATRGEWPLGVYFDKRERKFRARCSNPFSKVHESIGYYSDPQEAHEAWRKRKHELACIYADMQEDERIAKALRTRYLISGKSE